MLLLILQVILALMVLNALRPPRNAHLGALASFPGMFLDELAGWYLVVVGVALAVPLALREGGALSTTEWIGLTLAVLNVLGLVRLMARSSRVAPAVRESLSGTPGISTDAWPAVRTRSVTLPFALGSKAVRVERDLAYGDAPKKRNLLDIHLPAGELPTGAPVLIQIHGGTWMYGNKKQQGQPLMTHLVERGWICVSINYRLAPANEWPAHIVDVKKAIAWVKENIATYGGDPEHVVLTGGSAGGHLAALAALTPNDPAFQPGFEDVDTSVAGCVPLYGVYDVAGVSEVPTAVGLRDFMAKRIFKRDPVTDLADFVAASPIARVTPQAPDFFVLHGTNDSTADIRQAHALVAKLRQESAARVEFCEVPDAQHMFDTFHSPRCDAVVEGIGRWLHARHAAHSTRPGTS